MARSKAAAAAKQPQSTDANPEVDGVVLVNMTQGPLTCPYMEGAKPHQRDGTTRPTKLLTLLPGLNMPIPRKVWDECLQNDIVKIWTSPRGRRGRMLEEVQGPPTDIHGRELDFMLDLCADVEAVKWWRKCETRPDVANLLDEKIQEMSRLITADDDKNDPL